jgi:hypothetical protein
MQIKLTADNFVSVGCSNPVIGEIRTVNDELGRHLIEAGVAVALKIDEPTLKKSDAQPAKPTSVSAADLPSPEPTANLPKGRARKSSR